MFDIPEYITSLIPYPPGKPMEEFEREYGISNPVKLASNENSLGPSPVAVKAMAEHLEKMHRYPDGSGFYLKEKLASLYDVSPDMIVLGNGSNELIDFLIRLFIRPNRNVISSRPSFLVYSKMVQISGGENIVIPLRGMHHDLRAILDAITPETRLIFLDNPNNPTATVIKSREFDSFLDKIPGHLLVVLDEAYGEFVRDPESPYGPDYVKKDSRIVCLRTFSKAYGLAGLRIGYGIMSNELSSLIDRVRQPFNVNAMAMAAALAALDDREHLEKSVEMVRNETARLCSRLEKAGFRPMPGNTNFMLIDVHTSSKEVYEGMLREGVITRAMDAYGFPTCIRHTVGLPEENEQFLTALEKVTKR